ncbi:HxlR family transcriptional regulator [Natronococcus jeotgali DSM 18795]|uniref:HxlR family transcriptional regulator n=2 Tax=Natronococcus jeotgali TaxID=413812 RepID=L9Y0N4_9EURY|nr:HxlR family transcriptional regulator [Natronococcus jeotgali DSM 18795]
MAYFTILNYGYFFRNIHYYEFRSSAMSKSEIKQESKQSGTVDESTLFSLLGKAHPLAILKEIVTKDQQSIRFSELQSSLGLSPNTLSRRLDELVEVGFLERTQYDEIPPRVEYRETEMVDDLTPVFQELEMWMERHGSDQLECS